MVYWQSHNISARLRKRATDFTMNFVFDLIWCMFCAGNYRRRNRVGFHAIRLATVIEEDVDEVRDEE